MFKTKAYQLLISFPLLFAVSCTSHAVISPEPLKPDETYQGVILSVENMLPQFVYRTGLGEKMDGGIRIGMLPVHGSGVDVTFVLRDEGKRLHTMNFAATYAEQSSFEATYYNVSRKDRSKTVRRDGKVFKQTEVDIFNYGYLGLRYAYIPTGFWGDKIHLFGLLYGLNFKNTWGAEIGYFHDFSGRTPVSKYSFNPKYAPLTGLSMRIWFGQLGKK
ncbi:MAG: hypothetical protein HQ507_08210 [Candidatus Marinimicrobia bacterium]|nr:hypothetical protein [Candidatus Neomarinimicrobiota bacterium]